MNQIQNKHSSKNNKKYSTPAKLISEEYAVISHDAILIGTFKTLEEVTEKCTNKNVSIYKIMTYKINNKILTIKTNKQ